MQQLLLNFLTNTIKSLTYCRHCYQPDGWAPCISADLGHLDCLKKTFENYIENDDADRRILDPRVPMHAAKNGNVECLAFLHSIGCPWDENTPLMAVKYGHLNCLQYCVENNCPWSQEIPLMAARVGNYECLRYAVEHGCYYFGFTSLVAADNNHLLCYLFIHLYNSQMQICNWEFEISDDKIDEVIDNGLALETMTIKDRLIYIKWYDNVIENKHMKLFFDKLTCKVHQYLDIIKEHVTKDVVNAVILPFVM
jgi:hypothetical protein